jgi:hypothetical protein
MTDKQKNVVIDSAVSNKDGEAIFTVTLSADITAGRYVFPLVALGSTISDNPKLYNL